MQAVKYTETRTTSGVVVETKSIAYRDGRKRQGLALGPRIKVTRLAYGTARNHGFTKGEAYSIKEYGAPTAYVGPHAVIVCEGETRTMRSFYDIALTL